MKLFPLIATPCYGNVLCLNYVSSILRLRSVFWQLGIEHEFYLRGNESAITRARNSCVDYFRAGPWSHLFFIDADIGFEPAAAVRLLYAKRDVVAGIYQLKHEHAGFPFDIATLGPVDGQGFAEVREAPTGFMCIAGDVFTRMHRCGISRHEFFDNMIADDEYLTEDFAFCRRWRALGGAVHVDTKCALSHQGTKLYTGTPEWPSPPTTIS